MSLFQSGGSFALSTRIRQSLSVVAVACSVALLWVSPTSASVPYNTVGGSYSENFDSLPTVPTTGALQGAGANQFTNGWQDDTTTVAGNHVSIPGVYLYHDTTPTGTEVGTNSHQRFRVSTGSQTTGSFYSFGIAGTNAVTDRAIGNLTSNTIDTSYYGIRLTNNTGVTLGQFTLQYAGEQWRDANTTAQTVNFSYAVTDTTPTNIGIYNATTNLGGIAAANISNVAALNFTSIKNANAGTLDGNNATNRTTISATINGLSWAPNQDLWLRWADIDHTGNDHGMGIDDLLFSANVTPVSSWTGATSTDWNTPSNWDTNAVPVSGGIAAFNGAGNGNTTVSLGATARPIGIIRFDTVSAAAYTLGSASEQFDIDNNGTIAVTNTVAAQQTVNAKINGLGALTIANNSVNAGAGLTIGASVTSSGAMVVDGAGTTTFNGPITSNTSVAVSGAGSVTFNGAIGGAASFASSNTGTMALNAQSTYTGNTSINSTVQNVIRLGASTVGSPGSVTSGPFGTGSVTFTGSLPSIIQPTGSDITIANSLTLSSQAFFAATAPASVDPTVRSLTFTGPITTVGARTITNNIQAGGTLTLGSASSPSTITLGGNFQLQTQVGATPGAGTIVINDSISGAGAINAQNGATVYLNNNNTNSVESNVQNSATGQPITTSLIVNNVPVLPTDAGIGNGVVVRTGTLAGTGTIAGSSRMVESSNGPAHLAPGGGPGTANGAGKLTFYNDLTLSPASNPCSATSCTVDVEIGGLTPGAQHDQVAVGGALTLGDATPRGTLNVSLINGFVTPTTSTDFTIMTGSSVVGTFANVNLPDANWSIVYNPTSVVLHVAGAAGLLGDFNSDGKVDASDYVTWRKNETANSSLPNDNGAANQAARYTLWRSNFGNPPGAGSGDGLGNGAVPEPGTLVLLVVGLMAVACPRRALHSRNS